MTHNPLLEDIQDHELVQTVTITLPTQGRFYQEEDEILAPGTNPDDLEIRPIGIMAEMYAKDPFMVAAGKGLGRIVAHVCPSVLKPERLCEVDVEAILLAARLVSHGPEYIVNHKCENPEKDEDGAPVCEFMSEVKLDLQKTIMQYAPIEYNDDYIVDLPEFNQRVFLRPIEYRHSLNVVKRSIMVQQQFSLFAETSVTELLTNDSITEDYALVVDEGVKIALESYADGIFYVESAGGINVANHGQIIEWLDALPETVGRRIGDKITKMATSLRERSRVTYVCPQCGHENTFALVLDPQLLFFSKAETSRKPKTPSTTSKRSRRTGTRPPRTSRKSPTPSQEQASDT